MTAVQCCEPPRELPTERITIYSNMCVCVCARVCLSCADAFYTFNAVHEQSVLPWQLMTELALVCVATLAGVRAATHTHTYSAKATRKTAEEYLRVREHWHSGNTS